MTRDDLINTTRAILAKAGFDISPVMSLRSVCFDVVGRKGDTLLIIKILSNVDAFSRENAEEIKVLAETLHASPILVGERSSSGVLEPGIVYSRFNISIVSNETLADHLLSEAPPFIFAAPGGLYVRLDSDLLKKIREENGISLGTLAEMAGVSRRTIQMYESGMGAMIDAALRLEEYLNVPLIEPVDPFEYKVENTSGRYELSGERRSDSIVFNHLLDIGFAVTPVSRSPFEALTRSKDVIILTGLDNEDEKLIQKAMVASDISRISGKQSVIIVEKKHGLENVESTAIVTKDELKKMDDKSQLTDVVMSRGGKK
jgi:putative transcriptional regulator